MCLIFVFSGFVSCFSLLPLIVMSLYIQFFILLVFHVAILLVITLSMVRRLYVIIVMFVLLLLMLLEIYHFLYGV